MDKKKYNRIIILGPAGSGKTTLSLFMSKLFNIEPIHLDKEYWLPNWERPDNEKWNKKLQTFVDRECWIIDGNYIDSLDIRLEKADLVIMLDIDANTCVYSIILRTIKGYFVRRKDLAKGCEDKFDESKKNLISWARQFKTAYFPQLIDLCIKYPNVDIKLFRTRKSARKFVERIKEEYE